MIVPSSVLIQAMYPVQDSRVKHIHFFSVAFVLVVSVLFSFGRETRLLDSGWRFEIGDTSGAERNNFDDHDWQTLSIPHNWGWEEAQQGKSYYRGPGWYRRDLNIGKPQSGRRYFIRFE